jgi:hypothetical protein
MTDQNSTPATDATTPAAEVNPNLWNKFNTKYPRAARVVTITGVVVSVAAVAVVSNNVRKNREHLSNAAEEAKEALREMAQTVSPEPETN